MTSDEWFDKHVIVSFGDFNNKEDKKQAEQLKQKLKEKMIIYTHMVKEEIEDDSQRANGKANKVRQFRYGD